MNGPNSKSQARNPKQIPSTKLRNAGRAPRMPIEALVLRICLGFGASCLVLPPASAADWGHLTGRFVYDGVVPEQPKLELNKDVEFCGKHDPRDEALVVDPKTNGIANVFVWLDEAKSKRAAEVHESYTKQAEEPAIVANAKCRFEPHARTMRTGGTLKITNEDPIAHATAVFFLKNDPLSTTLVPNGVETRTISRAEAYPVPVSCPIHAWMKGWLLVQEHPYAAVSKADGSFELKHLPAGEWTFHVWHESVGNVDAVTLDGQRTKWTTGRFTIVVPANETKSLGDVTIAADEFDVD
jgi:hypothetical protein